MSFKYLSDHQILALAIDEWLMGLDDDGWEQAIKHIEKRKRQRAMRKKELSETQELSAKRETSDKIRTSLGSS